MFDAANAATAAAVQKKEAGLSSPASCVTKAKKN
jgi:hypothetical protein